MNLPWAKHGALQWMECQPWSASGMEWLPWCATKFANALYHTPGSALCQSHPDGWCEPSINLICSRAFNHREYRAFLSDIDAEYGDVVYHSNVRWLSRGSALQRFYSLRSEIDQFLKEKNLTLDPLNDPGWLADLAFLVDLTSHLNALNKNLQGKDQLISEMYAHLKSFSVKLRLFERQISDRNAVHFPSLSEIISSLSDSNIPGKMDKYLTVLTSLIT